MTASVMEEGQYDAATSAIFCEENKICVALLNLVKEHSLGGARNAAKLTDVAEEN